MTEVSYTVRNMTPEDVPKALDIWRETDLQEGTHTLYSWLTVDPEAFKIAVKDDGEVIGVCAAVIHHENLAFVGMYCVREKYRGLGIGFKVWSACMEHIGSRNASLNALPDKLELYRDRGGFPIVESDWVCVVNETNSDVKPEKLSDTPPADVDIVPLEDSHLPLICDYDQKLIGFNRQKSLELSVKEQDSKTLVALKGDACIGYGIIRMSIQGTGQVGPLYADDKDTAEVLLKRLILSLPQAKGFAMMTVSNNEPANELMRRIDCPTTEDCPRMYTKEKVDVDLSKVFAQFNLNFSIY